MTRQITYEEVSKHNTKDSVWIVLHGNVYDVTSYLEEHPGGEEVLLENAGNDGTQGFDDVGHSDDARELLKKYKIGTIPPGDKKAEKHINHCCSGKWKYIIALASAILIGFALKKYLTSG